MHKLAKGLKKKKKGKKSKHQKEEEFKPEELEAYRREHAKASEESAGKNEEWKNFLSLTSGVDDILKKTQDDLDRIKSTSFFQRIPPPSETEAKNKEAEKLARAEEELAAASKEEEPQIGIVQVSESESEEEEDDDIFDTAYIDAIAAGEVKLAYIPESPTDKQDGDDPFDTSIAERAILGPAVERKGKKLVPLGAAVEVLTGRVQLPTCATKPISRRQILKEKDLLLGSFDSASKSTTEADKAQFSPDQVKKTLLDDDEIPLPDEPIDLSKTLYIPPQPEAETSKRDNIVQEFEEDEDDKEFEALAAESLTKTNRKVTIPEAPLSVVNPADWKPCFDNNNLKSETNFELEDTDPFDTAFADNLVSSNKEGDDDFSQRAPDLNNKNSNSHLSKDSKQAIPKAQKTLSIDDDDFNPRALENKKSKPRTLSRPDVLNVGQSKTVSFSIPTNQQLNVDTRTTKPLTPFYARKSSVPGVESPIDPDPFDTSFVRDLAPGKEELKIIEKELFNANNLESDKDFDPRDENKVAKIVKVEAIKDIIVNPNKPVILPAQDLLSCTNDIGAKVLTPAAEIKADLTLSYADPFDTSIAKNILPGKAELKLLENELIEPIVNAFENNKDLLVHTGDTIIEKPLSPQLTLDLEDDQEDFDPFDTSFAANIQPGKAELKVLESELI